MASARQVAANRRNASLPRGPLSDEACAAIRENAVKHGLTAKHIVLGHEDYAEYQELRASLVMEYRPATPQEHRITDQIAQNYWRLLRSRRAETATFENRLGTLKDRLKIDNKITTHDDEGISICMSNDGRDFDMLRRYETGIERAWYRAIRELRACQKERRQIEADQIEQDAYNPPLEDTIAARNCESIARSAAATASSKEFDQDTSNPPLEGIIVARDAESVIRSSAATASLKELGARWEWQLSEIGIGCVSRIAQAATGSRAPQE